MIRPEAVVTFDAPSGFRIVRSFGTAYGRATRPRSFLRATFRSIGAFIGVVAHDYITEAERGRDEWISELIENAEQLGANGIVKLKFQASEQSDGTTRVLAFGEAVLLDPEPGAAP